MAEHLIGEWKDLHNEPQVSYLNAWVYYNTDLSTEKIIVSSHVKKSLMYNRSISVLTSEYKSCQDCCYLFARGDCLKVCLISVPGTGCLVLLTLKHPCLKHACQGLNSSPVNYLTYVIHNIKGIKKMHGVTNSLIMSKRTKWYCTFELKSALFESRWTSLLLDMKLKPVSSCDGTEAGCWVYSDS